MEYGVDVSQLVFDFDRPFTELDKLIENLKDYEERLEENPGDQYLIGAIEATKDQIERHRKNDFLLPSDILPKRKNKL